MRSGECAMAAIRAAIWLAALMIATFTIAQEAPTFKVDVDVVNVLATVHDRSGNVVNNLTKDDFILEENGKEQKIRYFSRQTDLPLTIGLLVDTSQSQRNVIAEERSASYQFFKKVLRPDRDRVFVVKFDVTVDLLQNLTNSLSSLQQTLSKLSLPSMMPRFTNPGRQRFSGRSRRGGQPMSMAGIGTVLYDAVYFASDKILQKLEGRKAIILISDGVNYGNTIADDQAIEAAHRSNTIIYSIRYFDSSVYGGVGGIFNQQGADGKATLKALSKETGGLLFEPNGILELNDAYHKIQEELRNQYNLGYDPPKGGGSGFREIKLRTKKGKFKVLTRAGYYPKK
jgi:VWFA-related protein